MDTLDDAPAQPSAPPAHPEALSGDHPRRRKFFGWSGDPKFRELEPAGPMVAARWWTAPRGV